MKREHKPHYRATTLGKVKEGDLLYSRLCGEAYPVDKVIHHLAGRVSAFMGCMEVTGAHHRQVFICTKPRTY